MIKVGFTTRTPEQRLREAKTFTTSPMMILAETPGTKEQEKELHRLFAASRHHGEWFEPTPLLEDLIYSLIEASEGIGGFYASSTSPSESFLAEWLASYQQPGD